MVNLSHYCWTLMLLSFYSLCLLVFMDVPGHMMTTWSNPSPRLRHVENSTAFRNSSTSTPVAPSTPHEGSAEFENSTSDGCDSNFVYIKVHKAASSLMNQILLRYGISKNKAVALPKKAHVFHLKKRFTRNMIYDYTPSSTYHMLINHARYNRPEMDAVVPNALYFASVRDPVSQFESAFGFFKVSEQIANETYPTTNTMKLFMSDPKTYLKRLHYGDFCLWNCQIFDLGLDSVLFDNQQAIDKTILRLEGQFDLVIVTEYLDESLILLKNMLCLNFTDILYMPSNVRSNKFRSNIPKNLSAKIRTWNSADVALYEHFNRTLWKRINKQGPEFWKDLETFRELKEETVRNCVNYTNAHVDKRTWELRLNRGSDPFCNKLTRSTVRFVNDFREKIINDRKSSKRKNILYNLGYF